MAFRCKATTLNFHLLSHEAAYDEGTDCRSEQGEVGVDVCPVSGVSVGQNGVEAGPVDPEYHGSDHCEEVRGVTGGLEALGFGEFSLSGHDADGETEVSAKDVDEDGTADILE